MSRRQGPISGFWIVLGLLVTALAVPASALGATAGVAGGTLTFTAASGEPNDLVVETDGAAFRVIDNTAPVTAGAGCNQRSAHRVNCATAGVTLVQALLADGDDSAITLIGTTDADLHGGSGADTLFSAQGDDTLSAGKGRNNLSETLSSAGGDDTLNGSPNGAGSTFMNAGLGDDELLGGPGGDVLFGDQGADLLQGGDGFDNAFWGGTAGLIITVNAGANDGEPGEGDDVQNVESMNGTQFNDSIDASASPGFVQLFGNAGNDTLIGTDRSDSIDGGDNADSISGAGGDDELDGGRRADDISGGSGTDNASYQFHPQGVTVTMNNVANDGTNGGAEGDNVHTDVENLRGSAFDDTLTGSAQDNQIIGTDGNDVVQGGAGDDELFGDETSLFSPTISGNDDLNGGDGDDNLYGGPAADDYLGGADIDLVDYGRLQTSANLTVTINNVADDGASGGTEGDNVMDTVENVNGGTGSDTITGSSAANQVFGGPGLDDLRGGNGPDLLDGETPGFFSGFAADVFNGGGGSDTVTYASHSFNAVTVDIGGGPDGTSGGAEGDDVQSTVENLIGSAGSDTLTGNGQPNTLAGRDGSDFLTGGAGGDHLAGNSGFDTHEGQGGKDEINSRGDGFGDTDNCGSEADTAIVDPFDTVNADCEDVIP